MRVLACLIQKHMLAFSDVYEGGIWFLFAVTFLEKVDLHIINMR